MDLKNLNMGDDVDGKATGCSICLESVTAGGDRSTAILQCGHEFHLDCIGSAFNAKGAMQCPNCRKVEKGSWLYANGYCSLPDHSMPDWAHDEDLYELNYSEMPFGWCPFRRLALVASSFEEGESSPVIDFNDLIGHHAIITEHSTISAAHPCPHMAYIQSRQPSSTTGSHVLPESPLNASAYNHHWSLVPGPTEVQIATDLYHNSQTYLPHSSRTNASDQASFSSATMWAPRLDSDGPPRGTPLVHPFIPGHRSDSRSTGSFVASSNSSHLSNSGAHSHVHEHYPHHSALGIYETAFAGVPRSGATRGMPSDGLTLISSDPSYPNYVFPSTGSSGSNIQDVESSVGIRLYAWESDPFAPYPLMPVDREPGWWGPQSQTMGPSDSSSRMGFWQQRRGLPTPTSSDPAYLYYPFPLTSSSGHIMQDLQSSEGSCFYPWERDHSAPYLPMSIDRLGQNSQSMGSSDSSSRMGSWQQRRGSERSSSQAQGRLVGSSYLANHASRMRPPY